jgi:hypothetical protein
MAQPDKDLARMTSRRGPIAWLLGSIILALWMTLAVACHEPATPEPVLFERAETRLRRGDYEGATMDYQEFLQRFPNSPLASIARQRLRNIDRELEAVMGRRSSPAPIYIRPTDPGEEQSSTGDRENAWGSSLH